MHKRIKILICLALVAIAANAQTAFLDQLRKKELGKGTVTVVQSPTIDSLVMGTIQQKRLLKQKEQSTPNPKEQTSPNPKEPKKQEQTHNATPEQQHQKASDTQPNTTPSPRHETVTPPPPATTETTEDVVVDTRKKVMRNSYKMPGYRIQVFSGGNSRADRQKAETAGAVMKSSFPNEPIYVHFYSPSWKCRMGNYKTVEEARVFLAKVKKLGYPQANIIKGTISVQY